MKQERILISITVAALLFAFGGCGASTQGEPALSAKDLYGSSEQQDSTKSADDSGQISPFAAYAMSAEDSLKLMQAQEVATATCMKNKGFTYRSSTELSEEQKQNFLQDITKSQTIAATDSTWGPSDPAVAKVYGYGNKEIIDYNNEFEDTAVGTDAQEVPEDEQTKNGLTYDEALQGAEDSDGEGGCILQAANDIGITDEVTTQMQNVSTFKTDADEKAEQDDKVTQALTQWSGCMKEKGYDYASPKDALSKYESSMYDSSHQADQEEQALAIADAQCKVDANLMDTLHSAMYEYEKDAVEKNIPALQQLQAVYTQIAHKADEILSQNPVQES